jgi:Acetyltransferases, including N-acetylases of ribosomal proteins
MLTLDFHKFPVIVTERLVLRQLGIHDAMQIYKLRSDLKVNELTGRNISPSLEEAKEHITKVNNLINNSECIQWGICLKETDTIIGTICFWNFDMNDEIVEIGYELLPEYHGNGIMTESMRHIIRFGFEKMNIKIVTAFPSANNKSSVALLVKFGFILDNKGYKNNHDHVINMVTYTFNRQNYFDSIANNAGSQHAI